MANEPSPPSPVSPSPYEPPKTEGAKRPAVIFWYRVYAGAIAFLSLLAAVASLWLMIKMGNDAIVDLNTGETIAGGTRDKAVLITMTALGVVFGGLHAFAAAVPYKPWAWVLGIVVIGLGVTGCTVVFAAPLLFYWIKPITKSAFQRL